VNDFLHRLIAFLVANTPPLRVIVVAGPIALAWALACLAFAGWLKRARRARTGDTRKVFHFLVFATVALAQRFGGTPLVCLFGGMVSLVVLYAIVRGDGHPLYEALAREKDAPHRTHYVIVPWLATIVGGLVSNVLFGPSALFGYLVTGIADAIAEPIGTRFGRHVYRVPSRSSVKATRSVEGSLAVFLGSLAAIVIAIALLPDFAFAPRQLLVIPIVALVATIVEALSPHGWDNATLQLAPSWLAQVLLLAR
jgi:phytol kinase